ncbi:MAG: M20/M25/M40 family metallo-hydrolase [Deltaproteobacteria bacterium]|nr:M20/M25/M40 family metallo-hydrolase [Deltaproteobacteria bacterium]MBT7151137.1 M20/M25/M40 family metallo-hydrolase [Deltaproteobacteria bacterium]MBT7890855.1 M20/M25/M40 family metallo-hydrolase [Deltaproteobacteria bacterium]
MIEEITKLAKSLIQIPSVHSRPHEIIRCAEFIEDYLNEFGIQYQRFHQNNTPSILVLPKSGKVPILLMSHFDVVEGEEEQFLPYEQDGCLFGRGSLDDKYAVSLSLVLLKKYFIEYQKKGLNQDDLPFGILMTGDEEAGGMNGANHVLSFIKTEFCITLDGGSINDVITKEKGILQIRLVSKGKTAHSARPWTGINAIEMLIKDYHSIETLFNGSNRDNWHRTLNFSKIEAGSSFNNVPGHAEAIFDIRYTENDDIDGLLEQMVTSTQSELFLIRKEPLFVAKPSQHLDLLLEFNPEIQIGSEHGSSDARFLSKFGINGVVWGANGNRSHHSIREHVNLKSIETLCEKIDHFIRKSVEINNV